MSEAITMANMTYDFLLTYLIFLILTSSLPNSGKSSSVYSRCSSLLNVSVIISRCVHLRAV